MKKHKFFYSLFSGIVALSLALYIFREPMKVSLFRAASLLTDPVCKSHEYLRRFLIEEQLDPMAVQKGRVARAAFLSLQLFENARKATYMTFPGIVLRALATRLSSAPFLDFRVEEKAGKKLDPSKTFTLLSWNICCVGAGYPISDGGVLPWSMRMEGIVKKILAEDADVVCLYETFDTSSAFRIYEGLKESDYCHFYFNIGPRAIGASSGIFVASKFELVNPTFVPFPVDSLLGRTKNAEKGVFAFDVQSDGESFARIFATHLQHSEEPEFSTEEEKSARAKQMQVIVAEMNKEKTKALILTGDLNLDDREYADSSWHPLFDKGVLMASALKTWGGDAYCATLMGKKVSLPLNLDHTLLFKGSARSLKTRFRDVHYDSTLFKKEALSDHLALFSEVAVDETSG